MYEYQTCMENVTERNNFTLYGNMKLQPAAG